MSYHKMRGFLERKDLCVVTLTTRQLPLGRLDIETRPRPVSTSPDLSVPYICIPSSVLIVVPLQLRTFKRTSRLPHRSVSYS